MTSKS